MVERVRVSVRVLVAWRSNHVTTVEIQHLPWLDSYQDLIHWPGSVT